jgi:hypothetical protein
MPLLQFSTFTWLLGGAALIVASVLLDHGARMAISVLVGSSYTFGAVANAQAVRTMHFGWLLMTAAVLLIVGANLPI